MKNFKSLLILAFFMLIYAASSTTKTYYQVYETKSENSKKVNNVIKFEDSNCIISYNLWENGGDIGFVFFNKTEEIITLNKDKCFFIMNGVAYDYFLNRLTSSSINSIYSNSKTYYYNYVKSTDNNSQAVTNSTTYQEMNKMEIPPKTMKSLNEYKIVNTLVRNCNLLRFPKKNETAKIEYQKENSPYTFSNYLNYTYRGQEFTIQTEFYVSSISNLPEDKVAEQITIENCGTKTDKTELVFTISKPDMFYVKYTKGSYDLKY